MSKPKFKELVLRKINALAARQFSEIQSKQQKTKQLQISDKQQPAPYLFSKTLCQEEVRTLFKLRSSTIDVKGNMSSSYKENMWCRTCFLFPESQQHLLHCSDIRLKLPDIDFSKVRYEMIYENLKNQECIAKLYHLILQARSDILNTWDTTYLHLHRRMEDPCTSYVNCGATNSILHICRDLHK